MVKTLDDKKVLLRYSEANISKRLTQIRKYRGYRSQDEAAYKSSYISAWVWCSWDAGNRIPCLEYLIYLSNFLNVDVTYFIDNNPEMEIEEKKNDFTIAHIHNRLEEVRLYKGYNFRSEAVRAVKQFSQGTWSDWENGVRFPLTKHLITLAHFFDIDINFFLLKKAFIEDFL